MHGLQIAVSFPDTSVITVTSTANNGRTNLYVSGVNGVVPDASNATSYQWSTNSQTGARSDRFVSCRSFFHVTV